MIYGETDSDYYITCRVSDWVHKFFDIKYQEIEFDKVTAVPDIDHANMFFYLDNGCHGSEFLTEDNGLFHKHN